MGLALRRFRLAGPWTDYTPAAAAIVGLLLLLHVRLWRMTVAPSIAAAELATLPMSCVLVAVWGLGFLAWAVLRRQGLAPDAPRAGLDLALWGLVAREAAMLGPWIAVPPRVPLEREFPVHVLRIAEATSALGLLAFGWGLALVVWGGLAAVSRKRTASRSSAQRGGAGHRS